MSNNIKYRQLKAFTILVETGSFSVAAEHMSITQPSLSTLIQELERDVAVRLIDRSVRRAEPTEEGRNFYEHIKGHLTSLEDAYTHIKDVGQGKRGRLRVACVTSLSTGVVTRALCHFHAVYPGVQVTLHERTHREVLDVVRKGEVDLGVGVEVRGDTELSFLPVFKDRLLVVMPPGHSLAKKRAVSWKNLDGFNMVMVTPGPASLALRITNPSFTPAIEVENATTALALVQRGMGLSILPSSIVGSVEVGDLVCRPLPGSLAVRSLGIICKKNAVLSAAARSFVEFLTTQQVKEE